MRRKPGLQEWITFSLALIRTLGYVAIDILSVMPHSERLIQILRAVPAAANAMLRAFPARKHARKHR